jgi:hypothetical protein
MMALPPKSNLDRCIRRFPAEVQISETIGSAGPSRRRLVTL